MTQTEYVRTKEEAIEAWNAWPGRARSPTQEDYNRINDPITRDYPIRDGKLLLPDGKNAFGGLTLTSDGGFKSPWPKVYFSDDKYAESGFYGHDDIYKVYKLRARWRLIEINHVELKKRLELILSSNDRNNNLLNNQLSSWNQLLINSGFPLFEENDLRGVDLSGLNITPKNGNCAWLRDMNFNYAELHFLKIVNGYLYKSQFIGVHAAHLCFSHSTLYKALFQHSFLTRTQFISSNLTSCNFQNTLLTFTAFCGSDCSNANFESANLGEASFTYYEDTGNNRREFSNLPGIFWNEKTRFEGAIFDEYIFKKNPELAAYINEREEKKSLTSILNSSVEIKPNVFGINIDIIRLLTEIKKFLKKQIYGVKN